MTTPSHKTFVAALRAIANPKAVAKVSRFFWQDPDARSNDNKILGVSIGSIFPIAKRHSAMPLHDIEKLLDDSHYEVRMGAAAIMDFQARSKGASDEQRRALFDLYIRRHDRINNWDLVDRAAPYVVGGYLADRPRKILYKLAKSKNPWERRTAIVATYFFIRMDDVEDTFKIAQTLVADGHPLVQKAVGSWLREAGKRDRKKLLAFLDTHCAAMPAPMLRYAVEKLTAAERTSYLRRARSADTNPEKARRLG